MEPRDIDLAYSAAAIDGEGCIALRCYSHKGSSRPQYKAELSVANCDPRMPNRMKELFGGKVLRRSAKFRPRPLYEWRIQSKDAAEALRLVRPYMIIKGEQADIFLQFCATLRRVGYGGHSEEVLATRAEMKNRIAVLKVIDFEQEEAIQCQVV